MCVHRPVHTFYLSIYVYEWACVRKTEKQGKQSKQTFK